MISCAAAWAIWGWKAAQQREKERTIAACRSYVAEYERFRASSQQISIPLTFTGPQGTSFSEQDVKNAYLAQRALNGKGAEIALSHRRCFFSFLIDQAKAVKDTPTVDHEVLVTMPRAGGCQDGWLSPSIGKRGACSHHGGVVAARPWAKLHYSDHLSGRLKGLPIPLAEAADPRIVIEHDDLD